MKRLLYLFALLFCLALAPAHPEEEADNASAWRPYPETCMLCNACRTLKACEALGDKGELATLCRRYAEEHAPACRAQLEASRRDGMPGWALDDMEAMLAESEAILRGEEAVPAPTPSLHCGAFWECLPCDGAGEPWLTVPKAQARLREASDALFAALDDIENREWEGYTRALARLLPLYADYRREMQLWGVRSLSEERLQRWEQEDLLNLDAESLPCGAAEAWLDYLRADAEEAEAQYHLLWRRACRRATGRMRSRLGGKEGVALPTERAWFLGEPAPTGASAEAASFYRLRDALAFCTLAEPLVGKDGAWRTVAEMAQKGEYAVLSQKLEAPGKALQGVSFYSSLNWGHPLWLREKDFLAALWPRAGMSAARLAAPARSGDEGNARVEAAAAEMAALLDEAERQLPTLPEGAPDAACRRLLVRLAARWNAYAYALRRWGRSDYHRSFVWYGGCMGYRSVEIWGEAYYLPGIKLYTVVNDKIAYVDRGNARALLTALVGELRTELTGSLEEHREPAPAEQPQLPQRVEPALILPMPEDFVTPS